MNTTVYIKINSINEPKSATFVAPKGRATATRAVPFLQTSDEPFDTIYVLRAMTVADEGFNNNKEEICDYDFVFASDDENAIIEIAEDEITKMIVKNGHASITDMYVSDQSMYYKAGQLRGVSMVNRKTNAKFKYKLSISAVRIK